MTQCFQREAETQTAQCAAKLPAGEVDRSEAGIGRLQASAPMVDEAVQGAANASKLRRHATQVLPCGYATNPDNSIRWMVGAIGIEPVTPAL